jgi:membrane fusion protein, multidrug efflux system
MEQIPENTTPPRDPAEKPPSSGGRKGFVRRYGWILLLIILSGVVWRIFYLTTHRPAHAARGRENTGAIPVTLSAATTEDFPIYLDGLGTVQAFNSVLVNARVPGLIQEIRFKEGQEVKQGDILAVLDSRTFQAQYDQAAAKTLQDIAQLESAKITLARDQELIDKNVLDHQTYDTQRYLVSQLQAAVRSDQANEQFQKAQLDWTLVTAPISGYAGVRYVDVGNQISAGGNGGSNSSAIVVINQIRPIFVSFTLPQQDLSQIREAILSRKALEVTALDRNNQTVLAKGSLSVIDNQIDTTTATIKLKAAFPNDDYKLWPGQFVNVRLRVGERPGAVVVPTEAIQLGPDGSYVYVVGQDNKAEMRGVTAGSAEGGMTLVESGLKDGEKIVIDGQYRLQPGSTVTTAPPKNIPSDGSRHRKHS